MTRQRTRWGLLAAAAFALASASCAKKQTILLVEIYGPVDELMARQFGATVTAGLDTKAFTMPAEPATVDLTLPASFTLTLDQSRTGPVTVSINAYDVSQSPVGFGTTTMDHIVLGGQTIIPVRLTEITDPGIADGGADAGEDGHDAGQDMAQDMAQDTVQDAPKDAAKDGASGQDAREDRMSLDAAAD